MENGTLAQWRKTANTSPTEIEERVRLYNLQLLTFPTDTGSG